MDRVEHVDSSWRITWSSQGQVESQEFEAVCSSASLQTFHATHKHIVHDPISITYAVAYVVIHYMYTMSSRSIISTFLILDGPIPWHALYRPIHTEESGKLHRHKIHHMIYA